MHCVECHFASSQNRNQNVSFSIGCNFVVVLCRPKQWCLRTSPCRGITRVELKWKCVSLTLHLLGNFLNAGSAIQALKTGYEVFWNRRRVFCWTEVPVCAVFEGGDKVGETGSNPHLESCCRDTSLVWLESCSHHLNIQLGKISQHQPLHWNLHLQIREGPERGWHAHLQGKRLCFGVFGLFHNYRTAESEQKV